MKKVTLILGMAVLFSAVSGFALGANTGYNTTGNSNGSTLSGSKVVSPFTPVTGDSANDNNVNNANNTGVGVGTNDASTAKQVIKSYNNTTNKNQRTHGEYQNNTNSCASCHQTHTGAGKGLLFKNGVYETCTACHDGTLGFYNVFEGSTAGTFGGTQAGNASFHLANNTTQISAAPGNVNMDAYSYQFNCASCHAPHGSYSDRLLHYNPNNMANVTKGSGGQKLEFAAADIYTTLPTANAISKDQILLKTTANATELGNDKISTSETFDAIVLMKKVSTDSGFAYVRDTNPWVYGRSMSGQNFGNWLKFFNGNTELNLDVNYGNAYAKDSGTNLVADVNKAEIPYAYVVKLHKAGDLIYDWKQVDADESTQAVDTFGGVQITAVNPSIYDEPGIGVGVANYCGACHRDYLVKYDERVMDSEYNTQVETGMVTYAYRHTTNEDKLTCLKCHFAHGTDVTVMKDAKDNDVITLQSKINPDTNANYTLEEAKAYLLDKNPSSALKRYTNMSVCWKCHTEDKSSELVNNSGYWSNPDAPKGPNNW